MEQWHIKNRELGAIKGKYKAQMSLFNNLRVDYSDWFVRQQGSFLYVLKSLLLTMGPLVPQKIQSISDLREIINMSQRMRHAGQKIEAIDKLDKFMSFWQRYCSLKYQLDQLMEELDIYVRSITRLREPEVWDNMTSMHRSLNLEGSEAFKFGDLHNERDNLYTYRIKMQDSRFLGLAGFMPYLLTIATKLCFQAYTRINLEKE